MKILIVGAGLGGLTLGAFLEKSHIEYKIIEKNKSSESGFLLIAWDNMRDILRKLGLSENFDREGVRIKKYQIKDGNGKTLRNYDLRDFYLHYGTGITMIERTSLKKWLTSKIPDGKIFYERKFEKLKQSKNKVTAFFSDGTKEDYDLVIGADGVHSTVRKNLFKEDMEKYENWRVWWTWVPLKFSEPQALTEYVEPEEMLTVFSYKEKALAVLVAPAKHSVWDSEEGRINRITKLFSKEKMMDSMLKDLKDSDVMPSDLLIVDAHQWAQGRAILLGDAVHFFGPYAGLGGSMAMEDAYVLASELLKVSNNYNFETAIKNYEKKRKRRVSIARRLNARIRLWSLIKSPTLRKVFNFFIPYVPEKFIVRDYNKLLVEEI